MKMIFKDNKQGFAFSESIVMIFSLVIIAFTLVSTYFLISNTSENITELSPELTEDFPTIYLLTFLNMPVSEEYIIDKGLNRNLSVYQYLQLFPQEDEFNKLKQNYTDIVKEFEVFGNDMMFYYKEYLKNSNKKKKEDLAKNAHIDLVQSHNRYSFLQYTSPVNFLVYRLTAPDKNFNDQINQMILNLDFDSVLNMYEINDKDVALDLMIELSNFNYIIRIKIDDQTSLLFSFLPIYELEVLP